MDKDLSLRLFRAIGNRSWPDAIALARKVAAAEQAKGHVRLARHLQEVLGNDSDTSTQPSDPGLRLVPLSRRTGIPLLKVIPHEHLRHHMVLKAETASSFERIRAEYTARSRLAQHGLRFRNRLLFWGAPGVGKTLAAEKLAFDLGLPVLRARFDVILSSYLGESGQHLREVFEAAERLPSVLLLDECDFFGRSRLVTNDVGEAPRIVSALLQMVDDFRGPGLLVATTNLRSKLDPALLRRFDSSLEMTLPTAEEVVDLLKFTFSAFEIDRSVRFGEVAAKLKSSSHAVVVKCAEEAAKGVVLAGGIRITQTDILRAVREIASQKR